MKFPFVRYDLRRVEVARARLAGSVTRQRVEERAPTARGLAELLQLFEIVAQAHVRIIASRDYKRYSLREEVNHVIWRQR